MTAREIVQPSTDWMEHGACQGKDPDLFFPGKGRDLASAAVAICMTCPVRLQCLEYALATDQAHGVWGGKTAHERRAIRRARRRNVTR